MDLHKKPLGLEERKTALTKIILSINLLGIGLAVKVLNFGTVSILVGDAGLSFDSIFSPYEVHRELFNRLAGFSSREQRSTLEEAEQRMADWIETYQRLVETDPLVRPRYQ